MVLKKGKNIFPGIEDEVALEQAKGTISNIADAIVELITNSDDSYLGIEQDGKSTSGIINIHVKRLKGGKLKEVTIIDEAAGMTPEKLEKVITYGKKTSSIYEGKSVRGFFGRGLKESIIAIGSGEILTTAKGIKTHGKYYYDYDVGKLTWFTFDEGSKTSESSGTKITITAGGNEDINCPSFKVLKDRIKDHYAIRDIFDNQKRKVCISYEKVGTKSKKTEGPDKIKPNPLIGQQIFNKKFYLKGFGVADFKLYEAHERLYYSRNDPCSQAGIRIKTSNATLENQLFGYDSDPYAHYFFGEVYCPGIFEKLKAKEKGLIKSDRKGLYWNHNYCTELEKEIKKILTHHIDRKKKQTESQKEKKDMPKERAEKLEKLLKKLNSLSRELLSVIGPEPSELKISHLTILPPEGIAPTEKDKFFSVYTLNETLKKCPTAQISLDNPKGKFKLSSNSITFKKHDKREDLAIGSFKIRGFIEQDKTGIIVTQGKEEDYAEFVVGKGKKFEPKPPKGGLFKNIEFDIFDINPIQRVHYDKQSREIKVYVHYPGISPHLGENGEGAESDQGSMLLSELVGEAFCRETARRKVEDVGLSTEAKLDGYLKFYDEHLKLCIPIIHKIILS